MENWGVVFVRFVVYGQRVLCDLSAVCLRCMCSVCTSVHGICKVCVFVCVCVCMCVEYVCCIGTVMCVSCLDCVMDILCMGCSGLGILHVNCEWRLYMGWVSSAIFKQYRKVLYIDLNVCSCGTLSYVLSVCDMFGVYVS